MFLRAGGLMLELAKLLRICVAEESRETVCSGVDQVCRPCGAMGVAMSFGQWQEHYRDFYIILYQRLRRLAADWQVVEQRHIF